MIGVLAALSAGYGAFLLYTAVVFRWRGLGLGPALTSAPSASLRRHLQRAGLGEAQPLRLVGASAVLAVGGGALAYGLFGGFAPTLVAAAFAATIPAGSYLSRRTRKMVAARDAWPRMLEELRLLTGALGRSIPQALFEVGRGAPDEMQPAFQRAEREWLLTLDFPRSMATMRRLLADGTADVVCETLVVANEVGGGGIERRLADLAENRLDELQERKKARSEQAGVRFARRFVLVVPLGMALAGLSIGPGRSAYETAGGQVAVAVALVAVGACWVWAGRMMRLPDEARVFVGESSTPSPLTPEGGEQPLRARQART